MIGSTAIKDQEFLGPFKFENGAMLCFRPQVNDYTPVVDIREAIKAKTEKCPVTKEDELAFYRQRLSLAESADVADCDRKHFLESLKELAPELFLDANAKSPSEFSAPGGKVRNRVGYAIFYRTNALEFMNASALFFNIVSVPNAGDPKNLWLYLTATNRSVKGVEVLLYYKSADDSRLGIFDWSKKQDLWGFCLPHNALVDYLTTHTVNGQEYQTIYLVNSTRRLPGNIWTNEVLIYNKTTNFYDFIYSSTYPALWSDQGVYKWWGPMVEIRPPFPYRTNAIGFFEARLMQDGGPANLLVDGPTYLTSDYDGETGFARPVWIPNSSFIVQWT